MSRIQVAEFTLSGEDREEARSIAGDIRALQKGEPSVEGQVREILQAVRQGGDSALFDLAKRFDGASIDGGSLLVEPARIESALEATPADTREALKLLEKNVRQVSEAVLVDRSADITLAQGQTITQKLNPVRRVAAYIPGGRAPYPSTVIMCCVPADEAGVEEIVLCSPPDGEGELSDLVLAAAAICGVETVYRMGGAQAIAALAYGTESVEPVDLIVGPGNVFVQEAKRQVFGEVGIDGIAGPSEIMVVADDTADPRIVALDILAQTEHGPGSLLVVTGPDSDTLSRIVESVNELVEERPTVHEAPLAVVMTPTSNEALLLAEELAPEHLQLACVDADELGDRATRSGCVFLGSNAATAFGDYIAGSNHVLPTGGAGRFTSALGPMTFLRRQACVSLPDKSVDTLAMYADRLARAEGFAVHGESMMARAECKREENEQS